MKVPIGINIGIIITKQAAMICINIRCHITIYHHYNNYQYQISWEGISQQEILFSLPARKGGLGVRDPVESAQLSHSVSVEGTVKIVRSIKGEQEFSVLAHKAMIAETQARLRDHQRVQDQRKLEETLEPMDNRKRCVIMRAVDGKTSGWLNVLYL